MRANLARFSLSALLESFAKFFALFLPSAEKGLHNEGFMAESSGVTVRLGIRCLFLMGLCLEGAGLSACASDDGNRSVSYSGTARI
jgi:hypothetical protein